MSNLSDSSTQTSKPLDPVKPLRSAAYMMTDEVLEAWRDDILWLRRQPENGPDDLAILGWRLEAVEAEIARRNRHNLHRLPNSTNSNGFPRVVLDAIKERIDLPELIVNHGLPLRRAGQAHRGRCPWHDDQTPSLVVWSDHWRCFGCGAYGDAFSWMIRWSGLPFRQAVEGLAIIAGVELPVLPPVSRLRVRDVQRG